MAFANSGAVPPPTGWLKANGAELLKTAYPALFATIGSTYGETNGAGGVGTTHFRVPDLRGIFVRGSDQQTIDGVAYSGTLGLKQVDTTGPHTHSGTTGGQSQDHTHYYERSAVHPEVQYGSVPAGGSNVIGRGLVGKTSSGAVLGPVTGLYYADHSHSFVATSGQTPASTTETRPANIALLYCIKF